ncbi:MAG: glycoside hydrolase family 127 protein [Bacteroidaceae bacterium]|nr:glycoside hydrolase family 127 protein [Bacteroidaceae bacterium]
MKRFMCNILAALTVFTGLSQSVYPGMFKDKIKVESKALNKAVAFSLDKVKLLPGRFRDNMLRDSSWMVNIDVNRLVHSFRNTAGVFTSKEGGYMTIKKYGGWESLDCDLRGHTTGHLLSAYSLMYANTSADIFKLKGDSIVEALYEVQQAYGDGYLSAFAIGLIDRNIRGESVWAPWYTIHKILAGLIDQYLYANNEKALEIAKGMGNWAASKLLPLDETTRRRLIRNEYGGINEAFYNLYAITNDNKYFRLAEFFYHNEVIDPLKLKNDNLGTKHTNTFIPKVIAEMRRYELLGDVESLTLCEFFFNLMLEHHTFATGSCSDKEHFFDPMHMSEHISGFTGETCCSYNMLKLAKHLMCKAPSANIADYYEQVLYNHILGQQDPESGMVCYFMPLKAGAYKVYCSPENSFWCCVGSGFENHAKYAESIYMHDEESLYINLFIPSTVDWDEKGFSLKQITHFPESEKINFIVEKSDEKQLTIKFRHPAWTKSTVLKVNGKKLKCKTDANGYLSVTRKWKDGDIVELILPMQLALVPTLDNPNVCAVKYGPIVLVGQLGSAGMNPPAPFSDSTKYNDYYTYDYNIPENIPTSINLYESIDDSFLKKQDSKLIFENKEGIVLAPLYDTHHQRYVVYWNINRH